MKRYCFDLDGTLVKTEGKDYEGSTPNDKAVAKVRHLYENGHYIIIMTARGASSGIDWREFTANQLTEFGISYHELILGQKPNADYFIDDKAIHVQDWLECEKTALERIDEQSW